MKPVELLLTMWDRALAVVCACAGIVVLIVGWNSVSDTGYPAEQLPYLISAGLGGVFLLGVASTLWLSADLRDEWHTLDAMDSRLARIEAKLDEGDRPDGSARPRSRATTRRR